MKKATKLLTLLLAGLLCLSALASCGEKQEPPKTDDPQTPSVTDPEQEEDSPLLDREQAIVLAEKGSTPYLLVQSADASTKQKQATAEFREAFWAKTGAELRMVDDKTPPMPREILIGVLDGREESQRAYDELTAPNGKGFRISTVGEKIVLITAEEYVTEAMEQLILAIQECEDGSFGVAKDHVSALTIPYIQADGTLYSVGQGNYAYTVPNVNDTTVENFVGRFEREGYTKYDSHSVGESRFWTFVKDATHGDMVAYVMYHREIKTLRVTYGPMEYLPNVTPLAEKSVATPTITQMHMQMVDNGFGKNNVVNNTTGAPGMSYLLQLSDGRFIMIDGGNADGVVTPAVQNAGGSWSIGSPITTTDTKRLYDTMCAMLPKGETKPTIAVWFITHAHGDHMLLATDFVETYKQQIHVEMMAFNFLEVSETKLWIGMKDWEMNFRNRVETNFPGVKTWILHTGQRLLLPGCEVEVLGTAEDFVCTGKPVTDGNDISAIFRIKLGNTSFLVTGDAYPTITEFVRDAYGEALESDVLQMAHHGFEGSGMTPDFYSLVDPKICLWPCDEFRFLHDSRNLGASGVGSTFYMNWWLRNKPWTRGSESGARQHYNSSHMTTINATTGKTIS